MTELSQLSTEDLLKLYGQPTQTAAAGAPGAIDPNELLKVPAAPSSQPQLTEAQLVAAGQRQLGGEPPPLSWSEVPGKAISNLPSSAYRFGEDIYNTFRHPVDTLTNIGNVGSGVAQKLGLKGGEEDIQYADAVGQFFANRYGSVEGFKRALAEDPVGVVGDLSAVVSGGGAALARAPGLVGKVGSIAAKVGTAIDPIVGPLTAAGKVARTAAGVTTGLGPGVIKNAQEAARGSVEGSTAVRDYMRGNGDLGEIVGDADRALAQMRDARQQAYLADQRRLKQDRTVLDFRGIDQAIGKMSDVGTFKGVVTDRAADAVRSKIINEIDYWKQLDPALYHTPEGLDALKKSISSIANNLPFENKSGRLVVKQATDAVKASIEAQAPFYAKMMRGYHNASTALETMQNTFSLGDPVKTDAALRKLTSAMRNNVNTNFGYRTKLVDELNALEPGIKDKITGASLNSWTPRGFGLASTGTGIMGQIGALATGSVGLGSLAAIPLMLGASSPRLVGETARAVGAGQRYLGYLQPRAMVETARQAQRTEPKRLYIDTTNWGR